MKFSLQNQIAATAVALAAGHASAGAVFSTIQSSVNPTEDTVQTIFGDFFGSPFDLIGNDFINDDLSLIRIADGGLADPLNLNTGDATAANDQIFQAQGISVEFITSEADDASRFGIRQAGNGNAFEHLLSNTGGPAMASASPMGDFTFALINDTTSKNFSSETARNGSFFGPKFDQMISYEVVPANGNPSGERQFILAWEDRIGDQPFADYDYNDVVVLVTVIPSPATAGLLVAAGGIATFPRRRRD